MSLKVVTSTYGPFVGRDGVWSQVITPANYRDGKRPALFLDRDGVIIEDAGYIGSPIDVKLIPGAGKVISAANRIGWPVIVVTNQGGIGLGYFDWADFAAVQERIYDLLAPERAHIDAVFANPYHPRGNGDYQHDDHPSRKTQSRHADGGGPLAQHRSREFMDHRRPRHRSRGRQERGARRRHARADGAW